MSDVLEGLAGNKMLHLKQDIAYLRQTIAECTDEEQFKKFYSLAKEKETTIEY